MRAAVGKATLMVTKRLPQFVGLCEANLSGTLDADSGKEVTLDDLDGFWALVRFGCRLRMHACIRDLVCARVWSRGCELPP